MIYSPMAAACSPEFLRLEQSRQTYSRDEGARPLWPRPASGDGVPLCRRRRNHRRWPFSKTVVRERPVSKTGSEIGSLTLKRKKGESITIDGCIKVHVVEVRGGYVRVRISAPRDKAILRDELATVEA